MDEIVEREIALEGLEGLTLPSFWIRLSQEYKRLNTVTITGAAAAETDTTSKAFRKAAWESALRNAKIELYALPEPRDVIPQHEYTDLENYAFRDATGPTSPAGKRKRPDDDEDGAEEGDNAVSMEDTEMEEPRRSKADNSYTHGWKQERSSEPTILNSYGMYIQKDATLRGSCRYLTERQNITEDVRRSKMTVEAAYKKYGDKLVLVASSTVRERCMGVANFSKAEWAKLTAQAYCVLEVIVRHRAHGCFLCIYGTTMIGLGVRNLKQIHNYTSILQELGVVTKQKGRFRTNLPQQGAHQVLTYMFPTAVSRTVKTEIELYVDQLRDAITKAPAHGIPMALLPRLPDYQKDKTNKFRKRLKGFFSEVEVESVPKESLQDLYTNLVGDRNGMVIVVRLPATADAKPSSKKSSMKGRPPCRVPEDLEVTPGPGLNKSLTKATLLLFKENKERGLSLPDLEAVFAEHNVTKKMVERLVKQILKTGYVKPSGKFPGKNPAKRYVLVKNEDERHKRLAQVTGEAVDLSSESPSRGLVPVTTLRDRVLAWAERFRTFEDAKFLQTYYSFLEPDYGFLGLGDVITEVANAVDAGLLRFHLVQKEVIQPGSPGFSTFVSTLDASQNELQTYVKNVAFSTAVRAYLAPNKNIAGQERNSTVGRITVYQTKSRILRYRLFHRYLFCLAYESANPPPGGFQDWRGRIQHAQLARNLKGWVTFEDILRNMPLAVFARLTPVTSPADDHDNVIKNSVEYETTAILPLSEQSARVLRHIISDRTFVHLLRAILFCLRQMGLVSFGLSEGYWPDHTELYYVHDELTLKDTMSVPSAHVATGVMDAVIAAKVPDMQISFSSDYDVVNFWQDVGNQTIATKPRTRKKKTGADDENPSGNLLPVVKKKQENKLASQYQVKEAMPEVLQQMTPQTLTRPWRPPGSRLALCGFDPIIRLHVRYFWLHAEQASRNMQKEDGYIPELDSFQLDHLGAARRRKQADRGIDKPKYKKVKITTNGRAKRGPKRIEPRPKMVPDTVKRAFGNRWNGQLFRETLPWKMHEKLLMIVYIASRDLLPRLKQKRPAHVAIFPDLMEDYFPDTPLRRSRREIEVHLSALQRDDNFLQQTAMIRDIIDMDPKAQEIIRQSEARKESKTTWTLSEQYEEWRQLVRIGMDMILSRQKCSRVDRFLADEDPRKVNAAQGPSQHECIRQFVLGNLVMHTIIRGRVDDPRALNVAMRKEDQRVSVGMGFHLNFRGVIVTKKIFERHPDMVVNLGGFGMGPSMRFKDLIKAASESWLGVAVNVGQVEDMTGEVDPRVALPFYFDALTDYAAENHWFSDELDKRVQIGGLSSYLEENELFDEDPESTNAADQFKFVAVPGLRLEDSSFLGMSKLVQYEIAERFEAVKKEIEAGLPWSDTGEESVTNIAFDCNSKVFNQCMAVKKLVAEKQAAGVTKKFIWDTMEEHLNLPIEQCPGVFNILLSRHLIIPAGIEEVLYVAADHMGPWLNRAHNDPTKAFQPRPWLSFNGEILGDILYSHLQLVLLRICEKSSSPISALIRHFQPFFFGRNTIEIIEILVSLQLVKKMRCDTVDDDLTQLPITKDLEWIDDGDTEHIHVECKESVWHSVMGLSFLKELLHVTNKEPFSSGSAVSPQPYSRTEDSQVETADSQSEEDEAPAPSKRSREQRVVRKRGLSQEGIVAEVTETAEAEEDEEDPANGAEISEDESEHEDGVEELDADFFATSDGNDTEED